MAINSVNTNPSVFTALRSLNSSKTSSSQTQNRVSSGLAVSSALTDAASFAIGQGLRAELQTSNAISQGLNT
jgi:flagellin